jgi:hypothetical protein
MSRKIAAALEKSAQELRERADSYRTPEERELAWELAKDLQQAADAQRSGGAR